MAGFDRSEPRSASGKWTAGEAATASKDRTAGHMTKTDKRVWTDEHEAHLKHLQHLLDTGKATAADKLALATAKKQKANVAAAKMLKTAAAKTTVSKRAAALARITVSTGAGSSGK